MIDPLETAIKWLQADAALGALVSTRIAAKHRYGLSVEQGGWGDSDAGLMVRLDGGSPDLYGTLQPIRLEVRCYATSQHLCSRTWQRLVEMSRECDRESVLTSTGSALLYRFNQTSGPSMLYDPDVKLDMLMCFFEALVSEEEAL